MAAARCNHVWRQHADGTWSCLDCGDPKPERAELPEVLDREISNYLTEWIAGDMSGTFEGIETDGSD